MILNSLVPYLTVPFSLLCTVFLVRSDGPTRPVLYVQPEQIHLSLGAQPSEMVITWATLNSTANSTVWYGLNGLMDQRSTGQEIKFVDGGPEKRELFIHRVYLTNLQPNASYKYHVGSSDGWSEVFFFRTFPSGSEWQPRFVIYGDLGNLNGRTLGRLQDEVQRGKHDLVLHAGDMAYDLHLDNGRLGDQFMRQIEPIAAYVPYQVLPGNHERAYNFSNYVNRFTMHSEGNNEPNNHFWSYNIGPVHVIAFSTEFLYYPEFGTEQIATQYRWLEEDLRRANLPENRAKHPWIVTAGHRAIYTQSYVNRVVQRKNRYGPGFEELFYRFGVDLQLWAHEHIYERTWPVYNDTVFADTDGDVYHNPKAPVHITTGSAGCILLPPPVLATRPEYSAFALSDYSFTHMTVLNQTHIHLQQISEDKGGKVVDDFYLIKDRIRPLWS